MCAPAGVRRKQIFQASMALRGISSPLDERLKNDSRLRELWHHRPVSEFIHPRAVEAVDHPIGLLMIHAEKLLAEQIQITPKALARSLEISVATLYRRYKARDVRRACKSGRGDVICKDRLGFDESGTVRRTEFNYDAVRLVV
jgi:hypothetical protein